MQQKEPFNPDELINKLNQEIRNKEKRGYSEEDIADFQEIIQVVEKYKALTTGDTGKDPSIKILIRILALKGARIGWKLYKLFFGEEGDNLEPPP